MIFSNARRPSDGHFNVDLGEYNHHQPSERPIMDGSADGQSSNQHLIKRKPISSASAQQHSAEPKDRMHDVPNDSREISIAPQALNQGYDRVISIFISTFMVLLTLPLFVLAIIVGRLHTSRVDDPAKWATLQDVTTKLVTIFPIVFALVVGRAIRMIAGWKLVHGSSLGQLEQLMGSLTVGGAVTTNFVLPLLNIWAPLLLVMWALSPLGSQSSIRMLSVEQRANTSVTAASYWTTRGYGTSFNSGDLFVGPSLQAMYLASLMSPSTVRTSSMDLWGNVKVPDFSRFAVNSSADSNGWYRSSNANITYSSLIGIPLRNITTTGNSSLALESVYISVKCTDRLSGTAAGTYYVLEPDVIASYDMNLYTGKTYYGANSTSDIFSICINGFYPNGTYGTVGDFINDTSIHDAKFLRLGLNSEAIFCPITTAYVENLVQCVDDSCRVEAMRPSRLTHPNSNLTDLGFSAQFDEFSRYLMQCAAFGAHPSYATATELFIESPELALESGQIMGDFQNLTLENVEIALQQIVNTFWFGSFEPSAIMGHLSSASILRFTAQNSTNSVWEDVYICHFEWLVIYILASSIMFLAAAISLILSIVDCGPEVLGYVSSLVINSLYVSPGCRAGSALHASSRSRKLKHVRLTLVDVEPENDVGYIAIAEAGQTLGRSNFKQIKGRQFR